MKFPDALPKNFRAKLHAHDNDSCWEWTGAINSKGYGSFGHEGNNVSTHRLSYELLVGPIPDGLQLDHLCRNRVCCKPSHLEPVTAAVNQKRGAPATKTHCASGHRLAGDNLYIKTRTNGQLQRNCRRCNSEYKRAYRERVKGAPMRKYTAQTRTLLADHDQRGAA